ncbi:MULTISPECIES: alpha/beta fold hydrolase [unclassified Pseudoclavibacter]|uniref:alpha/beta fold hydrolase n=1 Tax=unclassified Pseudoclavibacter TaxID=2615177 RepID=UPI000CE74956|nr:MULTISPECIES: alpha/beta hydrolase [unclassified Pseudoclavibacter]MBF4551029.1 alpha/beta hydrolase [Pseudoclavibacter sp. VKM Ac-2888]PPF35688.1 alpha/beta hydrolase [Pseudoclavibacter sp. AY1H1]PPF73406.1 alpha/beta hydrolase [Pseudoclavibacter sp. Z016]
MVAAEEPGTGGVRVDRETVLSADGTRIAYEIRGSGPVVLIVNGAFSTARDVTEFALALVRAGFAAVAYDRRARGDSGDTKPSAPEREAEDLAAVIGAVGGQVSVVGHSSGAVLALFAASLGVPVQHLFLSEPPFRFGQHEPAPDLAERLQRLVDEGEAATAVSTFQLEGVGLDPALVEQIRQSPIFPGLMPLAQSTVYDAQLVRQVSTPTAAMVDVQVPVTIVVGGDTFPFLASAARRLAETLPGSELVEVAESVGHRVHPEATAKVLAERLL